MLETGSAGMRLGLILLYLRAFPLEASMLLGKEVGGRQRHPRGGGGLIFLCLPRSAGRETYPDVFAPVF